MTPLKRLEQQLIDTVTGARPTVPEAGVIVWRAFLDLAARRSYHMSGPNPISMAEIEAYARLHRLPLQPHHVALICAIDDAWLKHVRDDGGTPDEKRRQSSQPMTPAIFDALF
ncbi:phage tail assembly chaperone [Blastochloris viridis]|uniref:Uncharacterized protein n=1 Tax=Blastochloris viridis TaxID=1079 RepID=A0A0H5BJG8_BLAVI|nr:hypothetical protein [Blastochloris viridis]ALK09508.1 hypothetical protein BVIR_1733 [Blastochloris viridis]BAS00607.1 hypothetical protein BV133_3013 [Blastochloris viridis]CUU42171.1 hypothetical protein BVIRIDIS_11780 [Blastochloris viridis]